ncbi:MAG TPA: hypothetical protein VF254_09740 [Gammaproteobacteria bacterium]
MASSAESVKQKARELLDKLPDTATWDDVVYELAVRRSIERGKKEADAGALVDIEEIRREFQ